MDSETGERAVLRWLKLSVVAFVGCGFLGMIAYALWMREEIKSAQLEPPLIAAPDMPVKRRPDEPGGMDIPNRDKLVFDLLDNSASATAPEPAPVDGQIGDGTVSATQPTGQGTQAQQMADRVADQVTLAQLVNTAPASGTPASGTGALTPVPEEVVAAPAKPVPVKEAVAAAPQPVAVVATAAPAKKVEPVVVSEAKGNWGVQLAAVGSQADATKVAGQLKSKFPVLKSMTLRTAKASTPAGIRYRVQFVGAESRAAATKVCDQLGAKQPCFAVGG